MKSTFRILFYLKKNETEKRRNSDHYGTYYS